MQTVDVGEPVTLFSDWWSNDNQAVEPATIELQVTPPSGVPVTYVKAQMTGSSNPTSGTVLDHWTYTFPADAAGVWRYTFVGDVDGHEITQGGIFLVGMEAAGGPCEQWCEWDDLALCGTPPELSSAARELVLDNATEILFNLSGLRYPGLCTTTRSLCFSCARCAPNVCSCVPYPSLDLGGTYPVWGVLDVTLDGVTLDPSAYTLRDRRWLVRLDGQVWPTGWHVSDPAAFRATWVFGRKPPPGGVAAAAAFSYEIALLCAGDEACKLPQRVTTIQREGISYTILDPMAMIAEGRTGLPSVDLWLTADAKAAKPPAHLFVPGLGGAARVR